MNFLTLPARVCTFLVDLAADQLTGTIKFGQLTVPAPARTTAGPAVPAPTTPPPAPPRAGLSANPHLMAYDCLFDDDPLHTCVDWDGEPVRAGGSCRDSDRLLRHPVLLKQGYPQLWKKAEQLGLLIGATK